MKMHMNIHYWELACRAAALALLSFFSSCTTIKEDKIEGSVRYPAASSLSERLQALESNRPKTKMLNNTQKPDVVRSSTRTSEEDDLLALSKQAVSKGAMQDALLYLERADLKASLKDQDELVKGYMLYESGQLSRAYEIAINVWDSLEQKRAVTYSEDLARSPMRECALLVAAIQTKTHQFKAGISLLENLIHENRKWFPAYAVMFDYYLEKGANQLAEKVARAALDRVEPQTVGPILLLARSLLTTGKVAELQKTLNLARAQFSNSPELRELQGALFYSEGKFYEGCEEFGKAYESLKEDYAAMLNQSICLIRQGGSDEAVKILNRAAVLFPNSKDSHLLLAIAARKMGQVPLERAELNRYLSLTKEDDVNADAARKILSHLEGGAGAEVSPSAEEF